MNTNKNSMKSIFTPFFLITLFSAGLKSWAENKVAEEPLSKEFLEFLAEFGEVEDETFDVILHHGLEDAEKQKLSDQASTTTQESANQESSVATDKHEVQP